MLEELKGKKIEVVFGAFDAVDGEVSEISEDWIKLEKKSKTVFVQIEKIVRIHCKRGQ